MANYNFVIGIREKIPIKLSGPEYIVTDNSDYTITLEPDSEWDGLEAKTIYYVFDSGAAVVHPIIGNNDKIPIIQASGCVHIGVSAGELHTTRPLSIHLRGSIRRHAGTQIPEPAPDVYDKIMQLLNDLMEGGTGTDITLGITNATVGQIIKITEVDENGAPVKWESMELPAGDASDAVLSVNGVKPDENGNVEVPQVQADYGQLDTTAVDFIKNKIVGKILIDTISGVFDTDGSVITDADGFALAEMQGTHPCRVDIAGLLSGSGTCEITLSESANILNATISVATSFCTMIGSWMLRESISDTVELRYSDTIGMSVPAGNTVLLSIEGYRQEAIQKLDDMYIPDNIIREEALQRAVDAALEQAEQSGAFDGAPGEPGQPGADGITPHIGDNGNWWIGDTDTGVSAQGPQGEPGDDYILTESDKTKIAEEAAALVDTALLGIIGEVE